MKKYLLVFIFFCYSTVFAQNFEVQTNQNNEQRKITVNAHDPNFKSFPEKSFYSQKDDWQYIIDTTWGPGLPTRQKLQVFDDFWSKIDQYWGGFPNLDINWDSLRSVYRPLVEAGVSRGRFAGILCRLTRALLECHAGAMDTGIDSTLGLNPFGEYPNFPSFYYKSGMPIININMLSFRTNFGAGLTLIPDNRILVYSVMPNHPLNLKPGDIILGYDGIPWINLLNELYKAELPMLSGGACGTIWASSTAAVNHVAMMSAGMNWGLFDTIDVVKYSTNDTMHYPTSLLAAIQPPYFIATEQLPVKGVPFPDIQGNKLVSWGIVEGTNIGYIYAWDWSGVPDGQTRVLFGHAVDELMHINHVNGLILDFRTNTGGDPTYANDGFKHLFNIDPTYNYSVAQRVNIYDHYAFTISATSGFTPTPEVFDHPIAVLLGPNCFSAGDYNAFRLRFHPMARSFGKSTNGAYVSMPYFYESNPPYMYQGFGGCVYSNVNNEGYMIHKSFPVDEEVWLTRDGVAKGEDDVVKKALEWMNNKVYPHNTISDNLYYLPGEDSVHLFTTIENPNSHQISAKAHIYTVGNVLIDSIDFIQVGLNQQTSQWRAKLSPLTEEEFFKVSVTVFDETDLDRVTLPYVTRFTTAGPVVLDSISYTKTSTNYLVKTYVKNQSTITTITNASVKLICDDPWVLPISPNVRPLSDIPPGGTRNNSFSFSVKYIDSLFPGYFNFKLEIFSDGWTYWVDSMQVIITGVEDEVVMPSAFKLEQNYPNPFNSSSVIKYSIPQLSKVSLKIFNALGEELETLVAEEKPAGTYEITWDAENLPSGVYFYKLVATDFVSTKKMILIK